MHIFPITTTTTTTILTTTTTTAEATLTFEIEFLKFVDQETVQNWILEQTRRHSEQQQQQQQQGDEDIDIQLAEG